MSKKMGFWAVLSIVCGSQVGSGIFVSPACLAPLGIFGVYGWIFAGLGAILLAFVFSELCSKLPKTGGPHVYINYVFGRKAGFFVGWTYWLISWISTSVLVIAAVACLHPFLGDNQSTHTYLFLEICLLCTIAIINCKSVKLSGMIESVLTVLQFIPLIIVPAVIFKNFDVSNISVSTKCSDFSNLKLIITAITTSFWGFIGVECATTTAGAIENPSKTIPRAIIFGTLGISVVYFVNNLAIMGAVPSSVLESSTSPYVDAINIVLGKNVSMVIAVATLIVLAGTINAWTLTAAQTSLGLSKDGFLPPFFAKKNKNNTPYVGVLINCVGMVPILILTKNEGLSHQIKLIVDFSVIAFLIIYASCCLAFIKINCAPNKNWPKIILGAAAAFFCIFIIANSSIQSAVVSLLFFASGMLMLPFLKE